MSRLAVNRLGSRVCQGYVAGSDRDNAFHEVNYCSQRPVGGCLHPVTIPLSITSYCPDRDERVTPRKIPSAHRSRVISFVSERQSVLEIAIQGQIIRNNDILLVGQSVKIS